MGENSTPLPGQAAAHPPHQPPQQARPHLQGGVLRSNLANEEFIQWLPETMLAFANQTGAGGFSFDLTYWEEGLPVASEYAQCPSVSCVPHTVVFGRSRRWGRPHTSSNLKLRLVFTYISTVGSAAHVVCAPNSVIAFRANSRRVTSRQPAEGRAGWVVLALCSEYEIAPLIGLVGAAC